MASILIVDDSRPVRNVMRHVLEDAGFIIYEAPGGRAALEIYRDRSIDILIVDAHMPDWDGVTTLQAFREEFPDSLPRIMVMTGDPTSLPPGLDPDEPECLAHSILAKPFNPASLVDQIRQEVHAHRAHSLAG